MRPTTVVGTADLPADAGGFDTAALAASSQAGRRPTRSGTASSTAGTEFTEAGADRRRACAQRLAELDRPRAAAPAEVARRARRGDRGRCPDVPAVACFDTAFHATIPPAASTYAVPARVARAVRACGATGSTGCRTRTAPGAPADLLGGRRRACGWSPATWAPGRRSPPCATAAASTRRWGSRRSRDW